MPQERQHLTLGMLRRPAADTFGQRRGCHTTFNTQAQLSRMDGTQPWLQGFVEVSPQDDWAKQGGNGGAMRPAATIGLALPPQTRGHLFRAGGLHVMDDPGHDAATNLL